MLSLVGAARGERFKSGVTAVKTLGGRLRVVIGIVGCLLVGGCGNKTIIETVTSSGNVSTPASHPSSQAPSASTVQSSGSQPQQANVGSTITLHGQNGEVLAVTVDGIMDPLAVGSIDQADPGQRYLGVQITLKNVGAVSYSDSPSNGATLLSTINEQATGQIVTGGPCGNDFQSSVNIAPGNTEQGCLPFEMPNGQTPGTFQFTLNSGFADQTGQWSLAGADTSGGATQSKGSSVQTSPTTSPPAPSGRGGPLATLESYWASIKSHHFSAAYAELAPGAVSLSESQFAAQERQAGINSASFTGSVSSNSGSSATVDVTSLITRDAQFGCRSWSGSYDLIDQSGQWLIQRASISPSACS
jgi:hypothetical protein